MIGTEVVLKPDMPSPLNSEILDTTDSNCQHHKSFLAERNSLPAWRLSLRNSSPMIWLENKKLWSLFKSNKFSQEKLQILFDSSLWHFREYYRKFIRNLEFWGWNFQNSVILKILGFRFSGFRDPKLLNFSGLRGHKSCTQGCQTVKNFGGASSKGWAESVIWPLWLE